MSKLSKVARRLEKKANEVLGPDSMPDPDDIERELAKAIADLREDLFLATRMGNLYSGLYHMLDKKGFNVSNAPEIFSALKYGKGQTILEFREPNIKERVAQVIRIYEVLQETLTNQPSQLDEFDF